MLTDAMRADGWIAHDGGPCPVSPDSKPGIMVRQGVALGPGKFPASTWIWGVSIIAYLPEPEGQNRD